MASDDKKTKADAPAATAAPAKSKEPSPVVPPKAEGGETAADSSSSGYSRGEGQKPVSQAYKDNWNVIFGKKKKKKRSI